VLQQAGAEPLGVFEITIVGLPVAIVGVLVLSTIGPRLLPERVAVSSDLGRRAREFQMAARIDPDGPLVGRTIAESGLRALDGVFLAMIERPGLDETGSSALAASSDTVLEANDVCCFVGDAGRVLDLHEIVGLTNLERAHLLEAQGTGTKVFEAVVSPGSRLVGASLKSADFRRRYGGAVIAIHRADGALAGQLGRIQLRGGDVLLVLSRESFEKQWRSDADFSLVAALNERPPARARKSWLVVLSVIGAIVVAAAGLVSLFEASLAAAILVVAGRAISAREGWRSVNLNVVLTMAVAISLGAAVAESGLAADIAELILRFEVLESNDVALVVAVMLVTIVLTELLTNTAAAALMIPIALSIAADTGAEPRMLTVATLIAASCSFLSPVGYQTNLMVFGLGGYRFTDFARVGAPLTLSTIVTSAIVIPIAFG
jgi:di/tricarboxylate transporter